MNEWFLDGSDKNEFWIDEGCYITELLNSPLSPDASLALARVEVYAATKLHLLQGVVERYVISSGVGIIEIDGIEQKVESGDQAIVPADTSQRIINTHDSELLFYVLCTPRFTEACYLSLE